MNKTHDMYLLRSYDFLQTVLYWEFGNLRASVQLLQLIAVITFDSRGKAFTATSEHVPVLIALLC